MARRRREKLNEETRQQIKATARALMAEHGSQGISIRGIAREMGMTPPALYHYYPSLDDLITALIVDAFNALADAIIAGRDTAVVAGKPLSEQFMAATHAYRRYALDYPADFQLIYGSPIPGYDAAREITVPASARTGEVFTRLIAAAIDAGAFDIPAAYREIPDVTKEIIQQYLGEDASETLMLALHLTNIGWGMLHGFVMLELFGHLEPVVGDTDAFFDTQLRNHYRNLGLKI